MTTETVAALVDGELSCGAEDRAKIHLSRCRECREEVRIQRQAADRIRRQAGTMDEVRAPGSLLDRLVGIPASCAGTDGTEHPESGYPSVGVDGCRRPETLGDRLSASVRRALRVSHQERGRR
ncbi:anti-sigma factor [Corynebacterium terpenotabidum]|uniref:anti-sigma factor n=1 Tax=Corynebacterium terpenotabidum TaxID=89154 RepID=UPI001FE14980|nr:anti-sigma factor [Corynebacterium terpenotabidum]